MYKTVAELKETIDTLAPDTKLFFGDDVDNIVNQTKEKSMSEIETLTKQLNDLTAQVQANTKAQDEKERENIITQGFSKDKVDMLMDLTRNVPTQELNKVLNDPKYDLFRQETIRYVEPSPKPVIDKKNESDFALNLIKKFG